MAAIIMLFAGATSHAQRLGQGAEADIPYWRVAAALALSLMLAFGGAFALRWKMRHGGPLPMNTQRRLRLIERLRLNHQVDLCLVECDGREFMIATSPRDTSFGPETTRSPAATDV